MENSELIQYSLRQIVDEKVPFAVFNTERELIHANPIFAETLGYTVEEILHHKHADFCFSTYTEHPQYEVFWNTLLSGEKFQEQILRKTKTGERVFFEATYVPVKDADGNVVSVVKIAFDTTDRAIGLGGILKKIKSFTEDVDYIANRGVERVNQTITSVNEMEEFTTKNKQTSTTLLRETEQANDIITVIQDVAHQTRMLAVNSAIEAARLNEHGGSFNVISQEIRKLSNQVREEAVNIQERISKIEEQVKLLAEESNQINAMTGNSSEMLNINLASYEELKDGAKKINEIYFQIGHLFEEQGN